MNLREAQDWFAGEIHELRQRTRLTALQGEKLEAYELAASALREAEACRERPYWYGRLKPEFWGR